MARAVAITAVAPAAWGSTYWVTAHLLPPDRPLSAAVVRALPAGLALLALRRRLPRGVWWWRSAVLGLLTIGFFFPLVFIAGEHLPSGLAATMTATSPLVVMGLAWAAVREPAGTVRVTAAVAGLLGVALLVLRSPGGVDPVGVVAAAGAVLTSGVGFVLVKYWPAPADDPIDPVTMVSWQLLWGGLALLPFAALVEGTPPQLDVPAIAGFVYLGSVGTAVAYVCWFYGLARMTAGAVALIGLLNPVVGTLLGVALAGELFGPLQAFGMLLVLGGVAAGQLVRQPRRAESGHASP
ncbi:EamA family transporter [Nocardioides antri]|nr:EamA family transporter [Nocardioides antri]